MPARPASLEDLADSASEEVRETLADLALAVPDVQPSASLRERLSFSRRLRQRVAWRQKFHARSAPDMIVQTT